MACHDRQERRLQLAGLAGGKGTRVAQSHSVSAPRSRASGQRNSSAAHAGCEAQPRARPKSPSKVRLDGKREGAQSAQKRPIQNEFGWGMGLEGNGWASRGVLTMAVDHRPDLEHVHLNTIFVRIPIWAYSAWASAFATVNMLLCDIHLESSRVGPRSMHTQETGCGQRSSAYRWVSKYLAIGCRAP